MIGRVDDIFDPSHYSKVSLPLEDAEALPRWCFASEEFYRREIDRIFLRTWIFAGRTDEVANPGDYFTIEIAGEPLIITQSSSLTSSRPDYIGGQAVLGNWRDTLQYLNPAAFQRVAIGARSGATLRPGNIGQGAIRGPGNLRMDLSLGKNFSLSEKSRLQFRADAFNAFNHTNFVGMNTGIENPRFGKFTSTRGARVIQFSARLSF